MSDLRMLALIRCSQMNLTMTQLMLGELIVQRMLTLWLKAISMTISMSFLHTEMWMCFLEVHHVKGFL